ncbi:radical SAM protein [bacterium]|nr:radical SAM protein [bacterium]
MNICLIYPTSENPKWGNGIWPPLGIAYIGAVLEKKGHIVHLVDEEIIFHKHKNNIRKTIDEETCLLKEIKPDLVGITATTALINPAYRTSRLVKKLFPDIKIVLGGNHASIFPEEILEECESIDITVRGEGEYTMCDLADRQSLNSIKGVSYRNNDMIVSNSDRDPIGDLDLLPFPARHLLDMGYYTQRASNVIRGYQLRATSVMTTRGCPFKCTFCAGSKVFGKKVRYLSPERVLSELEQLVIDYKVEGVYFTDDMFLNNEKRAYEILELMIKKNLHKRLKWCAQAKVNVITENLLGIMKRAGCVQIEYGFESGSQRVLDKLNKKTTVEQNYRAARMTKQAGIRFLANIIVGTIGETEQDIKESMKFLHAVKPNHISVYKLIPLPATKVFEELESKKMILRDWDIYINDNTKQNFTNISSSKLLNMLNDIQTNIVMPNNNVNYIRYNLFRTIKALRLLASILLKHPKRLHRIYRYWTDEK